MSSEGLGEAEESPNGLANRVRVAVLTVDVLVVVDVVVVVESCGRSQDPSESFAARGRRGGILTSDSDGKRAV